MTSFTWQCNCMSTPDAYACSDREDRFVELLSENSRFREENRTIRVEYDGKISSIKLDNQKLQQQVQSLLDTRESNERKIRDLQNDVERMERMVCDVCAHNIASVMSACP